MDGIHCPEKLRELISQIKLQNTTRIDNTLPVRWLKPKTYNQSISFLQYLIALHLLMSLLKTHN